MQINPLEEIDKLIGEKVESKSIVLLEGPPGVGKRSLMYRFIGNGSKKKEKCAVMFCGQTLDEIKGEIRNANIPLDEKYVTWIDASGQACPDGVMACDISELFTVSSVLKDFLADDGKRVGNGVISSIIMIHPSVEWYKHLSSMINEIKRSGATAIIVVEAGMHDPKDVVAIEQLSDAVIEMKFMEQNLDIVPVLRLKKLRASPVPEKYFRFRITEKGIELV